MAISLPSANGTQTGVRERASRDAMSCGIQILDPRGRCALCRLLAELCIKLRTEISTVIGRRTSDVRSDVPKFIQYFTWPRCIQLSVCGYAAREIVE